MMRSNVPYGIAVVLLFAFVRTGGGCAPSTSPAEGEGEGEGEGENLVDNPACSFLGHEPRYCEDDGDCAPGRCSNTDACLDQQSGCVPSECDGDSSCASGVCARSGTLEDPDQCGTLCVQPPTLDGICGLTSSNPSRCKLQQVECAAGLRCVLVASTGVTTESRCVEPGPVGTVCLRQARCADDLVCTTTSFVADGGVLQASCRPRGGVDAGCDPRFEHGDVVSEGVDDGCAPELVCDATSSRCSVVDGGA